MTAVVDMYPKTFRVGYRRELLILGMSVASYILGLTMLTEVRKMEKQCIYVCFMKCAVNAVLSTSGFSIHVHSKTFLIPTPRNDITLFIEIVR